MTRLTSIEQDQLRGAVARATEGRGETGVAEIQRNLHLHSHVAGVAQADRRSIGRALRQLGWVRGGFVGIGYDREPRFIRGAE